jgi:serine/threonine-protein kinase
VSDTSNDRLLGRLLDGRYQVRSRIARGGMATVYLATDLRLERRVAVKVMHGHLADDDQFTQRFIQEARSAARLAHPNVVNVFDQGQDGDMAYLVMEYLPGITLRDLLREHTTLTPEQTLDILDAVLSGLAAAHKAGIVHRDLKPENVLLADDGRIKIGDFGLARAASANTATGAALLGTIAYLSPELVTRGVADTRSDIYAVGIMMYEMLAGEQPFKGTQPMQIAYQHAHETVPAPSTKNPRVPAELDELVLWATAREPDQRPRDARVMLEQLKDTELQLSTNLSSAALSAARTSAIPTAATTRIPAAAPDAAATRVLDAGEPEITGETHVLGSTRSRSAEAATTATGRLAAVTTRRRARGWWLVALVLLLAAAAGGTGWYLGPGPGGHTTVPASIVGQTEAEARAALTDLGLVVGEKSDGVFDPVVEEGLVAGTDPAVESSIARGSTVTLQLSKGPKPVDVPAFAGESLETAVQLATTTGLLYDETRNTTQFGGGVGKGNVLAAYGVDRVTGDVITLEPGATYFENATVFFLYSLGKLPAVGGLEASAAIDALAQVGVDASTGAEEFNDDVPAGSVIRVEATVEGQPIRPGDRVLLIVSKGPDLVALPDVIGESINDAYSILTDAEFTVVNNTDVPQYAWGTSLLGVQTVLDESGEAVSAGTELKRGATVTIVAIYGEDDGDDDEEEG